MQTRSHCLQRRGQLASFHKSGHFKLLPLLMREEPALGAVCNQLFLTQPLPLFSRFLVFYEQAPHFILDVVAKGASA